jgi:hypothetical protein
VLIETEFMLSFCDREQPSSSQKVNPLLMRSVFVSLFLFALHGLSFTGNAQAKATSFDLKDQNDKPVSVNFPSDRVVILFFGDRKGSEQIDGWAKPIYERYNKTSYLFGIASLSGVPSTARPLVRRLIRRQTSFPVLMDWGGKISRVYSYEAGKAMVVLAGKDGRILSRRSGKATPAELKTLFAEIDANR